MSIDLAHYHSWKGDRQSPWWACGAMIRTSLKQVIRRKAFWLLLFLGATQFLAYWAAIYLVTEAPMIPSEAKDNILRAIGFSSREANLMQTGYVVFFQRQEVVLTILLAFSGGMLVGQEFRQRTVAFYLSRRMNRWHYALGKLFSISCLAHMLTTIPALLLFFEFGLFTTSTEYWVANWRIPVVLVTYGMLLSVVQSIWLCAISAWWQRTSPIAIAWGTIFILLPVLSGLMARVTQITLFRVINPWISIRAATSRICQIDKSSDGAWGLIVLFITCSLGLFLFVRRTRAVDIAV